MKEYETQSVNTDILVGISCDICGKSCKKEYNYEYMSLKAEWGFDSEHDAEIWVAEICEDCVKKYFKKIKFKKEIRKIYG